MYFKRGAKGKIIILKQELYLLLVYTIYLYWYIMHRPLNHKPKNDISCLDMNDKLPCWNISYLLSMTNL